MAKKLTAIGGDIFAGLFTIGIKKAGFDVPIHLEHCAYGAESARLNHITTEVRIGVENWEVSPLPKKIDFMFTNPPCAPWSNANTFRHAKGGWQADPRLQRIRDLSKMGLKLGVKTWAWESVVGAWSHGRSFVEELMKPWKDAGYSVTILLQNNMYLGAPQNRKRVFVIAHKHPLEWPKFSKPRTVGDVLGKLKGKQDGEPLRSDWAYLWKKSKPYTGNLRRAYYDGLTEKQKLKQRAKPGFLAKRLEMDKVAPVMISYGHRMHPDEARYLTLAEWYALTGVPKSWKPGPKRMGDICHELSRAVLPDIGYWLGTAVKNGLALPKIRKPQYSIIDFRKPDNCIVEPLVFSEEV